MDGSYSIKQISHMVGYSDPNYFTWAFKKQEGVSPQNSGIPIKPIIGNKVSN